MKKFLNQIYKNLLSAIVAGACYALFALFDCATASQVKGTR